MNHYPFLRISALALMLFTSGWLGLKLAVPPGYASPLWPPAGIALAALLIGGQALWPGIWLGSFALNFWLGMTGPVPHWEVAMLSAAGIATGSTLQALIASLLSQRWVGPGVPHLDSPLSILLFLGLTGPAACFIAPTLGVGSLIALGVMPPQGAFFSWWNWWIGDSLGVILLTPLLFCFTALPSHLWRPRRLTVALPLLVVLFVLGLGFATVFHSEETRVQLAFDRQADFIGNAIINNINQAIDDALDLRDLYQFSNDVDRTTFKAFAREVLHRYPNLHAIEWIPRVPREQRELMERKAQSEGLPEFKITEKNPMGVLIPAQERAEYFPVYFIEPLAGNEKAIGFDIASEPTRRAALQVADTIGQLTATPRLPLIQGQYGIFLLMPIMARSDQSFPAPRGYTLLILKIEQVVEQALTKIDRDAVEISLRDQSAPPNNSALYVETLERRSPGNISLKPWQSDLSVANRSWRIEIHPQSDFIKHHMSQLPWFILVNGLLYTSLLGTYLLTLSGRSSAIQSLVLERTSQLTATQEELRRQNEHYQLLLSASKDAIHVLDANGYLKEWNDAFREHLGYSSEEVSQLHVTDWDTQWSAEQLLERIGQRFQGNMTVESLHRRKDSSIFPVEINATKILIGGKWHVYASARDITERKQIEIGLRKIEWMATPGLLSKEHEDYVPPYGEIVKLNVSGLLLSTVGNKVLTGIADEFMALLGTSCAIYEKNGDYAVGIFSSNWCRFLDGASRNLGNTHNNQEALQSGKWICHESCWTDASKISIETTQSIDIACHGGLRLYAVPIFAGKEVVGSINFGYGDPPRDETQLRDIAERYHVDRKELKKYAMAYESRPPFIISVAKKRLETAAELIGEMAKRKLTEDKLIKSEASQRAILDNIPYLIWLKDMNGCFVAVNKAFFHATGRTQIQEVLGKTDFDLWPKTLAEKYHAADVAVMATRQQQLTEEQSVMENGETRWLEIYRAPILDENGKLLGTTGFTKDITEYKQYVEGLRQAQKLAEEISLAKSNFLANMSHEIRTPMSAIIGLSELALYRSCSLEVRDYLEKIHLSAKSLLGILNDILDYSKIEAGRMTVEVIPFDLDIVLNTLHNLFMLRAEEKSLIFNIEVEPKIPRHLVGDAMRLQQVLSNLLGNAVKFTEQGSVSLRITSRTIEHSQIRLLFRVEDTGIGMSEETMARLFQSFTQGDNSISRRFGGTGLGLAISRELLLLMGSDFVVESILDQGSVFSFELALGIVVSGIYQAHTQTSVQITRFAVSEESVGVDENPEALAKLVLQLQTLLAGMNFIPNELIADLGRVIPANRQSLYQTFKYHIDQFDYKKALVILEKLIPDSSI
ncbi:putative Histidine kinase [Gammaproteobacteria bacterium]